MCRNAEQTEEVVGASGTLLEICTPECIYSADDSALQHHLTPPHPKKFTAERGAKGIQEKGVSTATMICFSASENFNNSVACSPQANYTDRATAACR
jgi:hypothetical protein